MLTEGRFVDFLTESGTVRLEVMEIQSDDCYLTLLLRGDRDAGIVAERCTMMLDGREQAVVLTNRIRPRRLSAPGAYYQTVLS